MQDSIPVPDNSHEVIPVDSVLDKVIRFAPTYESLIDEYRAGLYMKGHLYIRKRNFLIRYSPFLFSTRNGVSEYLTESYSELHYTAPDIYDHKILAMYGTVNRFEGVGVDVRDYMHINVYSASLLEAKLISPLAPNARNYYNYEGFLTYDEKGNTLYRLNFQPKNGSFQLVEGYMLISADLWSVRELRFSGRSEYLRFDNRIIMGQVDHPEEFVPVRYELNISFRMLGNHVEGQFIADIKYSDLRFRYGKRRLSERRHNKYDLTQSFTLRTDTTGMKTDSASLAALRPIALTPEETILYKDYHAERAKAKLAYVPPSRQSVFWSDVGDALFGMPTIHLRNGARMRMSPILDPSLFGYSPSDGLSYRQDFRFQRAMSGDRYWQSSARLGYNFKHKEFYWRVWTDIDYWPQKRASLHLRIGNGNRIYSSEVLEDLQQVTDTLDYDKMKLHYFRDLYLELLHRVEPFSGFMVDLGFAYHRRSSMGYKKLSPALRIELGNSIRPTYTSMAPRVVVSWTPGQYYYMDGKRKVNLHSRWPTITASYERGLEGVLGSNIPYECIELDWQHKIELDPLRSLSYRVGAGAFTGHSQLYFVDFVNFTKNNLPVDWNDEIGGVFQLLERKWYYSSRSYLRAHITYDTPFLALAYLKKLTKNIIHERIYFSGLLMKQFTPYTEVGYGIGTHIFDAGVFVSNVNGRFHSINAIFTFELFKR